MLGKVKKRAEKKWRGWEEKLEREGTKMKDRERERGKVTQRLRKSLEKRKRSEK